MCFAQSNGTNGTTCVRQQFIFGIINWYTKVILVATFVNFPLDIYHHVLNDSSLNNCHDKLLENDTFPVYILMPMNEYLANTHTEVCNTM